MKIMLHLVSVLFAIALAVLMVLSVSADESPNQFYHRFYTGKIEGDMYNQPSYVEDGMRVCGGEFTLSYSYTDPYSNTNYTDSLTRYAPTGNGANDGTIYHTVGTKWRQHNPDGSFMPYYNRSATHLFYWVPADTWINGEPGVMTGD